MLTMQRLREDDIDYEVLALYLEGLDAMPFTVVQRHGRLAMDGLTSPDSAWWVCRDVDKSKNEMTVALAGFHSIRPVERSAEPFIAVHSLQRNKGVGEQIARSLWINGVNDLNLRRITAPVLAGGYSEKILNKLGFIKEGTLAQARYLNGVYVDVNVYGWLRKE